MSLVRVECSNNNSQAHSSSRGSQVESSVRRHRELTHQHHRASSVTTGGAASPTMWVFGIIFKLGYAERVMENVKHLLAGTSKFPTQASACLPKYGYGYI